MKRKIETMLEAWKDKPGRMPPLLNGRRDRLARPIRCVGSVHFKNTVYINLETNLTTDSYFGDNISPEKLLRYLEASTGDCHTWVR